MRMATNTLHRLLQAIAALLLLLALTQHAHALDTRIGLDLNYSVPVEIPTNVDHGVGFAIHAGQELHIPLIVLIPEAVFSYDNFPGRYGPNAYRGLLGLELGIGEIFRPGVFAHIGYGSLHTRFDDRGAVTYDLGLTFDFTLIPFIDIGLQGAYNQLVGSGSVSAFQWITFGLHAALVF